MSIAINNNLESIVLCVYSPDAINSNLTEMLDQFISSRTGLNLVYRDTYMHDSESIRLFYQNSNPTSESWKLIENLFLSDKCIVSIWRGVNALDKLMSIKGKSHPSIAKDGTIRSQFWCDNAVCNLIHVSDSTAELERELSILGLKSGDFTNSAIEIGTSEKLVDTQLCNKHNGIVNLSAILQRNFPGLVLEVGFPEIPKSGISKLVNDVFTDFLVNIQNHAGPENKASRISSAFLSGNTQVIDSLLGELHSISDWEIMTIKSSVITRFKWAEIAS